MRVTFGLGQRLLHHIEPFQFVDSPEWYMMQNVSPQDVKASKIQVKFTSSIFFFIGFSSGDWEKLARGSVGTQVAPYCFHHDVALVVY